jgi:hypothetical protein
MWFGMPRRTYWKSVTAQGALKHAAWPFAPSRSIKRIFRVDGHAYLLLIMSFSIDLRNQAVWPKNHAISALISRS